MISTLKEHQAILYELLKEFDRVCRKNNIQYMLFSGSALGAVRHHGFIPWDDDIDVVMLRLDYERFLSLPTDYLNNTYFLQKAFSKHWPMYFSKLRKNETTCLEKYRPKDLDSHQGIYIDIFPCDNLSDNVLVRRLQFYSSKIVIAKCIDKRGYLTDSLKKHIFILVCRLLPLKPFYKLTLLKNDTNTEYVHTFLGGSSKYERSHYRRIYFTHIQSMIFEQGDFPVSAYYDELLTTLYGNYMTIPPEKDRECKVHAILVDTKHSYSKYEHYRDDIKFDVYTRSIR